jgi:cell wall-associated NlpC family hydrolase
MLRKYLDSKYEDGGRSCGVYDCWGLAREVRHIMYGKSLLPEYAGILRHDVKAFTESYEKTAQTMTQITMPVAGAIVAVYTKNGFMYHVGVVVRDAGELKILDTSHIAGAKMHTIREFYHRNYNKEVRFYD